MSPKEREESIRKSKAEYYQIGSVPCPAFAEEKVYFNRHGWNHIIRKHAKLRDIKERLKRIGLLKHAPMCISLARSIADIKETEKNGSRMFFWTIYQKIGDTRIRIVIRQRNEGKKHFFSIMQEEEQKNKKPR